MPPITVVVADHEPASRAACVRLLRPIRGISVVGKAGNGLETLAAARLKPRILLLDLDLSRRNGMSLVPGIRRRSPGTRVILLTRGASQRQILDALSQGVPGYLEKGSLPRLLAKAVRVVDAGEAWVPRRMIAKLMDRFARLSARPAGGSAV